MKPIHIQCTKDVGHQMRYVQKCMQLQISQIDCRNSRYCRNCKYHRYTAEIAELLKWKTESPHTCRVTAEYPATRKHSSKAKMLAMQWMRLSPLPLKIFKCFSEVATWLRSGWDPPPSLLNFLSVYLKWLCGYAVDKTPLALKLSKCFSEVAMWICSGWDPPPPSILKFLRV